MDMRTNAKGPSPKIVILPTPIKGEKDTKEYRAIRLENGLTICLVSDIGANGANTEYDLEALSDSDEDSEEIEDEEEEGHEVSEGECDNDIEDDAPKTAKKDGGQKMAACALCVRVGSFYDPLEVPGLAHFLEHMVFMGSERFPSENHFDSYISRRGGEDNASTDCEFTTFHFNCLEPYLLPAMDKFAQFFIAPLMKRDSMQREREAVESEFQAALPADDNRREQLICNMICEEGDGLNRFSWGNMKTLKDGINDDDLYARLHAFRKLHYSANRMTICVQSRLPLYVLEQHVATCFANIPNNAIPLPELPLQGNSAAIFPSHVWNRIYYVQPVREVHRLDLAFKLPPLQKYYRQKPLDYIGWLLGGEGQGSVLSLLKAKNWAFGIEAGNSGQGVEDNTLYTLLPVAIVLTEEGVGHWREVVEIVMGYIELLKKEGPQEWLYNEMAQIAKVRFNFAEEDEPTDHVEHLVECMQLYKPEEYLTGPELHMEYCPETINMVITYLRADNMNIMISTSKQIEGVTYDLQEKWFQTKYCMQDISVEWKTRWMSLEIPQGLNLPLPNNFLTTDFDLVNKYNKVCDNDSTSSQILPKMIIESPSIELWFQPDTQFKTPHVSYTFYLLNPLCTKSAENYCMLEILREMLHQELNEKAYPAILADLVYEFKLSDMGLKLCLFGYNQKLPELLELVSNHLRELPNNLNPDLFNSLHKLQKSIYFNRSIKPSQMTKDLRLSILMPAFYTSLEKCEIVENITLEKLKAFALSYLDNLYIQGLMCGNIVPEDALVIGQKLVETLKYTPISKQAVLKKDVKQLPKGDRCCRIKSLNPDDTNTHVTHYFQSGLGNLKNSVYIQLLTHIIEEPLFDTLRTKEQLGYSVYPLFRDTHSILGISITVQTRTSKASPGHVDRRIAAFLVHVTGKLLKKMSDKRFQQLKDDMIKVKLCEDTHLREQVSRLWDEIETGQYMFDRKTLEVESIKGVQLAELRKFWAGLIGSSRLIVQVVGQKMDKPDDEESPVNQEMRKLYLEFLGREAGEEAKASGCFIGDVEELKAFKSGLVSFVIPEEKVLERNLEEQMQQS